MSLPYVRPCKEVVSTDNTRTENQSTVLLDHLWEWLPDHLWKLVVDRLCLPDLFLFGLVCKPWKSICDPLQFKNHLPWLIVPIINNDSTASSPAFDNTKDVGFFSLCEEKIYKAELPEISNRRICGSFPGGWLMTVHENSEVQLFHPFKRALGVIHLPPLTSFPCVLHTLEKKQNEVDELPGVLHMFENKPNEEVELPRLFYVCTWWNSSEIVSRPSKFMRDRYITKVAMSSTHITEGTIIMAIQGVECSLVYYKIGGDDQVWSRANPERTYCFLLDLTYYKGKFYAVHHNGHVVVVNGLEESRGYARLPVSVEQIIEAYPVQLTNKCYILESSGDLLVVCRYKEIVHSAENNSLNGLYKTSGFKVLKIDFGTPNRWVEVKCLGDSSLFLGYNSSFSISSSKFSGCKPNCIYFTDNNILYPDRTFGGHDFGIFSLQDGSIEKFLYSDDVLVLPPPICSNYLRGISGQGISGLIRLLQAG